MIELRTLGTTDLRLRDGAAIDAVLCQPKRLALLVYLALAAPGRYQRRDTLLALFWPELDQDHARSSLRRSLSFLRKALPEPLIMTRGEDEVAVDQSLLWFDVVEFERRSANPTAALELYHGDFLAGFYVSGAPGVEQWLDGERGRLRLRAAESAWSVAEGAGDRDSRIQMVRLAVSLFPDDEATLLRAVRLLDQSAARREALLIADDYVRRLRLADDEEPGQEFKALSAGLRSAPGGTEPPQPPPAEPGLVAVLPFTVHGGPEHTFLVEGMVDLLATALDGAGQITCVDPRTILAAVRGAEGMDAGRARPIARHFGAERFILGSVVAAGGRLQAVATLYDGAPSPVVRAESQRVGEADLFELVDDLVRQLLAGAAAGPAGRLVQLAALTTASIPALRHYLSGERAIRLGRYIEAIEEFRLATGLDHSFALAHFRLAAAFAANVMIVPARAAIELAWVYRERLSEREQLLLTAQRAWLFGHTAEAERHAATLVARYPEDVEGWFLLGDLIFHSNPLRGRSAVESRPAFERALALDPGHMGALAHLVRIAALEDRRDDLAALVKRAATLSPGSDQDLAIQAVGAWVGDNEERRSAVLARIPEARVLAAGTAFADLVVYARELAGAERFLSHCLAAVRSDQLKAMYQILGASVTYARGSRKLALDALDIAARIDPDSAFMVRASLLTSAEPPAAPEALADLRSEVLEWNTAAAREPCLPVPIHDGLYAHLRCYLLGLVEWALGQPALTAQRSEEMAELDVPEGAEALVERLGRTLDAIVLANHGRPSDALAVLEGGTTDAWFQLAIASPFFAGGFERLLRADLLITVGRREEAAGWLSTIAERSPFESVYLSAARQRLSALAPVSGRAPASRHSAPAG